MRIDKSLMSYHESGNNPVTRVWWTLQEACESKGLNYKTAMNRRELQPGGGIADAFVGGRRVWHYTTIQEWLTMTDSDLTLIDGRNEEAITPPDDVGDAIEMPPRG